MLTETKNNVPQKESGTYDGIKKFLSGGYINGIGKAKADEIISLFGEKSLELFETDEGLDLLKNVKGMGKASIEKARNSYEENKKYKDIVLFLNGLGTKNQVMAIYKRYGSDAVNKLREDPYRLRNEVSGYGFIRADNIALASGIEKDCKSRVIAASEHVMNMAVSSGDCYLTMEELREEVINLLAPAPKCEGISEKKANRMIDSWEKKHTAKLDPETWEKLDKAYRERAVLTRAFYDAIKEAIGNGRFVDDDGRIYARKMYETECQTAKMLKEMCSLEPVRRVSDAEIEDAISAVEKEKNRRMGDNRFIATDEQRKAVSLALKNRVSIISGGPGRGKTAISEMVATGFMAQSGICARNDIIMLAPTGRAAQRITESTGFAATTAHRALLSAKTNGIPCGKLIMCDETSMADIFLMHAILIYARKCSLVFIGDVDQIASVGPGKVLRDMIDSKMIPCILLKEGHRNSGTIAKNSALINAGVKIKDYDYDDHFVYVPATAKSIADVMVSDYARKVKEYGIKDVMLCAAMKDRGACSVNKLNERLSEIFTKGNAEAYYGTKRFRVGDRVMQIKNDYEFVAMKGKVQRKGVFNGEKGTVVKIIYSSGFEDPKMVVLFDDGSLGGYTKKTAQNLTLAYATTLHKCQGSEAACVMMAYTFGDYVLLNRSLFYTGETRAKKEFRFYGEEKYKYGKMLSAFDIAVSKAGDSKRNTFLTERIRAA